LFLGGDSQYSVYDGRTAGVPLLLRSRTLPRLARLKLHELADARVLSALSEWPDLPRLEELHLTDDYSGRLWPADFAPAVPLRCLRHLSGVALQTESDVDSFLRIASGAPLRRLGLTLQAEHTNDGIVHHLNFSTVDRLLRAPALRGLESLSLDFDDYIELASHGLPQLADATLLPRLRNLSVHGDRPPEALEALRARFGPRLNG
jgi:hypothetical protein